MERRSESLGRLLKAATAAIAAVEGKTQQAVEAELGALIGVAGPTLQRYKAGHLPPDPQSVERLAEAGVRRGLLGRPWLERFLEAARLPAYGVQALVARLFPEAPPAAGRTPRPNLPPPTYTRFIMRSAPYGALLDGLRSALPVALVVSLGGMGKTSLARAAAGACLEGDPAAPRFAAAVWVSDKDRPGAANLSTTLDTIARVLDYPGLTALPFAQRQHEVEQLLRHQPVLLVVDNADTITDIALLEWLARLPGPSKAIVTSRFALPALGNAYLVQLGPLEPHEARALIAEWLPRSRLRGLPGVLDQLAPLAATVGHNPKAIELALGLLQHRARDVVLEEIRAARAPILDELFARAWELLDAAAQRVLLTLPLFPTSVAAEALAYCSDLPAAAFTRSAEQLLGLSLIDLERESVTVAPRYNAHALVRTYAAAALAPAERGRLRERWLQWCADTAQAVGFCWDDLDRLDREYPALQAAIAWAAEQQRDAAVIALAEGLRYYYNVRGLWGEEELRNHDRRLAAARRLGDAEHELLALAHLVQVLSKQGRLAEAAPLAAELTARGEPLYQERLRAPGEPGAPPSLGDDAAFEYGHGLALYARAQGDLAGAEAHWRRLLRLAQRLGGQKYVVNRRWLATALFQQGDAPAARALFETSLEDARRINDVRSVTGNMLKLAALDLDDGACTAASANLAHCRELALRYRDRRRLAEGHWLTARLLAKQGDATGARAELKAAIDLFERLGMRRELATAQHMLGELEQ